ncbi:helix-turn-helix domain-containing protein [Myxosarcina sp. GI1]|uniref:helix-turn-helix domain-containing protein n=1 Tax=Myxosarcina sp. GI1 TaxID=1541065 RepID=UPI001C122F81|nr:helix-turn-helix domain-containing protein [Myxosarcina sp. GI1]
MSALELNSVYYKLVRVPTFTYIFAQSLTMTINSEHLPHSGETLAQYLRRRRIGLKMSQEQMAQKIGIHPQSLGKIESGKTTKLSSKTKTGLSKVLKVSEDTLDAVCRGVFVTEVQYLKICPQCWIPGTEADSIWLDSRSKYCFMCGTLLRDRCLRCNELIPSLKFRFCGYCGQSYKEPNQVKQ